ADPRRGVDERDLAEPPPHAVGVDEGGHEIAIGVRVGLEPHEPSVREFAAEPVDQPAPERERERALEGAVRLPGVRAREDLLRRHVRRKLAAVDERLRAAEPPRVADEADVELRAWSTQLQLREAEL